MLMSAMQNAGTRTVYIRLLPDVDLPKCLKGMLPKAFPFRLQRSKGMILGLDALTSSL